MSFADLIKKGSLRGFATAIPATAATVTPFPLPKVARVATVAVATAQKQAANDPASAEPPALAQSPAPEPDKPAKLKYLDWADGWIELDKAYQRHHWGCPQCKAAGRGAGYGLRCGVGAALWRAYSDAADDRSALDW